MFPLAMSLSSTPKPPVKQNKTKHLISHSVQSVSYKLIPKCLLLLLPTTHQYLSLLNLYVLSPF